MIRFRLFFDNEIGMTHIEKHNIEIHELDEFFTSIPIWSDYRKDDSIESIGKLKSNRYLRVIYRKISKYDYYIITA